MKIFFVAVAIFSAFVGGFFVSQKYFFNILPKNSLPARVTKPMVGNDRDSHGCIGSAGYSWCQAKQKCLRTWEEPCISNSPTPTIDEAESLKAAIKDQLTASHGSFGRGLVISITKIEGNFARGLASESGGGGIWLAKKIDGDWKIVFEGNGIPDCNSLKTTYLFPQDLLQNICD